MVCRPVRRLENVGWGKGKGKRRLMEWNGSIVQYSIYLFSFLLCVFVILNLFVGCDILTGKCSSWSCDVGMAGAFFFYGVDNGFLYVGMQTDCPTD
jgi:hypothetical protein